MNAQFRVRFWGVRGSHPVPGDGTVRFGGNTSCVEVTAGEHTVILDAGTGIIPLGRKLARESRREPIIFFSHLHHDHTQGFPFFSPAYLPSTKLHIFGPGMEQAVFDVLTQTMQPPLFPVRLSEMAAAISIHNLTEQNTVIVGREVRVSTVDETEDEGNQLIRVMRSHAHPGGVFCYRIEWNGKSLVYATDTEGYVGGDRRLSAFAQGADLLIHDAQYTPDHYSGADGKPPVQGYGHSTYQMACQTARLAGVHRLVLFHHDPAYDDNQVADIERRGREIFGATLAAYEGLELDLGTADYLKAEVLLNAVQSRKGLPG